MAVSASDLAQGASPQLAGDAVISVRDLRKVYDTKVALHGVSFDVGKGEIVGLLGPNGAGKSTTMKILTTYLTPTSGSALVGGVDLLKQPLAVRAMLGYLPESTPLYTDMVVFDYLAYVAAMRGFGKKDAKQRIADVARKVGLAQYLGFSIAQLSKGYKQRVGLAQALLHNPPILILDEPTSGLDPNQIVEIRNLIRELAASHTVILSSHNLAEVRQICSRVIIVHQGRVVADGDIDTLEGRVAETHHLVLGIGHSEPSDAVLAQLRQLPGVTRVQHDHDATVPEPHHVYALEASRDVRGELARLCQTQRWTLLELRRKSMDLEAIFQKLTLDRAVEPA